ncbi:MAG: hypothetical protein Q9173_000433 [Seirophora scorigena]
MESHIHIHTTKRGFKWKRLVHHRDIVTGQVFLAAQKQSSLKESGFNINFSLYSITHEYPNFSTSKCKEHPSDHSEMTLSRGVTVVLFTAALVYHSSAAPAMSPKDVHNIGFRQVNNLSLGENPSFNMRVLPRDNIPVSRPDMLMTALDALTAIGLVDYRASSPPEELRFRTSSSGLVSIEVNSKPPATKILHQLATLCIYYGIINMLEHDEFTEADFECLWDHVNVADVSLRRKSAAVSTITTNSNSRDALTETLQSQFFYLPDAQSIGIVTAFVTGMNAIKGFSLKGTTEVINGGLFTDPGPHWDASTIFPNDPSHRPIRREPPFLEYRYALLSMRLAVQFMFTHRRFAELGMVIVVDGVRLGNALMIKGKPDQNAADVVEANVATA